MRHFVEMLEALSAERVEFLLVGGYALAAYGAPRATGDLDIWVRPSTENAERVYRALARFGAPLRAHGVQTSVQTEMSIRLGFRPNASTW